MIRTKREKLKIIKDILGVILLNRNIPPTRLLYKANLSPGMFKDYIEELIDRGLISEKIITKNEKIDGRKFKEGKKIYNLTELSREYLEDYKVVDMFLEKYGLD